jgi:hypothetical protein
LTFTVLRLERVLERLRCHLRRDAGLRADHAFRGGSGELRHFARARAVAVGERRLDPELARLLQHRAARRVHAAVEDNVGALALHLREDRLEVGRLVVGLLASDDVDAGGLQRLLDFVGEAFAVGRRVIRDRDLLGLELVGDVRGDRGTCWSSRPTVRKPTLKPCSVSLGFVAEPEIIGKPAWL